MELKIDREAIRNKIRVSSGSCLTSEPYLLIERLDILLVFAKGPHGMGETDLVWVA